jgi:hypothetical protein
MNLIIMVFRLEDSRIIGCCACVNVNERVHCWEGGEV